MEKEIFARWKIKSSETARILKLLPALVEQTRNESGNISYSIYQSATDSNEFILHERYADDQAADSHKNSAHYQNSVVAEIIPHLEVREVTVVRKLF